MWNQNSRHTIKVPALPRRPGVDAGVLTAAVVVQAFVHVHAGVAEDHGQQGQHPHQASSYKMDKHVHVANIHVVFEVNWSRGRWYF